MARLMLFLLPVIVLLSACGDDTTPASNDSTTLTNIYRFFIDANSDLNYINAKSSTDTGIVQTSTPANFNIASANYWGAVSGGTANSTGVSNFHPKAHLFNNGTNIIKVSSVVADGTPTAIQVSSEADLATYCTDSNEIIPDYASPNNSIIMYKVLISGGNCSTGTTERRWTTLGAASTDAVTVGGYGLIRALYNSDGSLSKLLIDNSNVLNLVSPDQDAANLVAITMADGTTPAAISNADVLSVDANNKMLIMIDDANIYSFDPTGTALSAPITATVSVDSTNFVRDSTHLYYSDLANIYRIAMDGSETSSTHIATAGNTVNSMALTPTRIVFQTAASATDVHSVLKTDDTLSATIATLKDSSGTTNIVADQIAAVAGEWIYYN
ncbi:MAG: hypothetical protein OEY38_24645, partial [Gammaproteobacteria bacterium]|nr:hypothetical protein [Gammaproteobacteria bacterium]